MPEAQAASALKKWGLALALPVAAFWAGSLWSIGFLAVPVLFGNLPDKILAGMLAGKMFTLVSYVGIGSACYLLICQMAVSRKAVFRQPSFLIVSFMLLLTLVGEFILQPEMAALKTQALPADVMHSPFSARFGLLHQIATGLYLTECLLGIFLVYKAKRC